MNTIDEFLDGPQATQPLPAQPRSTIDDFLGPVERPGIIGTLAEGFRSVGRAAGSTFDTVADYGPGVVERAREQAAAPKAEPLEKFYDDIAKRKTAAGEDPGLLDALGVVGGAVINNPKGAGYAVLEQAPNALAALAPAFAGMKGGAAVGALGGPVGATIGGVAGGIAGLFGGNALLEIGHTAMESAQDGEFTAEDRTAVLSEGATKAGVITGVDIATLGASRWITGATARAVERATTRALTDAGVDVTNEVALLAARRKPEIVEAVRQAQQSAAQTTATFGQKAARAGGALALETAGEGLGEYLGELAATGQADMVDAVLESVLSLGQSGAEVAWGASRNAARAAALQLDPDNGPISRAAIAAVDQQAIGALPSLDQLTAATVDQDAVPLAIGQTTPATIETFLGAAPAQPGTATPTDQPEQAPAKLLPLTSYAAAIQRAESIGQRTGTPHTVITHPVFPDRYAVVPEGSAFASNAPTLDVEGLFTMQMPIPLKNARRLVGLLSANGTPHAIVPSPTGRGFGVAPLEQLSPDQRQAWARFQPGTARGAARADSGPVAAPPEQHTPASTSNAPSAPATPIGTPGAAGQLDVDVGVVLSQQTEGALGLDAEVERAEPDLEPLDHGELNIPGRTNGIDAELDRWKADQAKQKRTQAKQDAATRKAQKAEAKRLFGQHGPAMIEKFAPKFGRKEIEQELDSMAKWEPAKFIDLAQRFEREQATAQATATPAVTPQAPAVPDAQAATSAPTEKPWDLTQDDFVKRVTFQKDGTRWSAQWNGQPLEAENEEFDHPTLGKTVVTGGRFFKTKREAAIVARGAHKRSVRRALINGHAVTPDVLAAYPDLQPATLARPDDQEQNTTTPSTPEADPYETIETRPDTTEAQRQRGRSALAALAARISAFAARSDRGSATLLGSGLMESFTSTGGARLVGQVVKSPFDLAVLAQVFRDPRFETFRVFYVKGDEIVGQTAYSSRLPAAVILPQNLDADIRRDREAFDADGYFVLHNHPSGKANPSPSDENLTRFIAGNAEGFRGHVVIDHNEYAVLNREGRGTVISAPELANIDFHSAPELQHTLLGTRIGSPRDLATIGKALQLEGGYATVILTRRQGQVQLLLDLPAALLEDQSKLGKARVKAVLRRMARAAGAGGNRFLVVPNARDRKRLEHLVENGIFTDVVTQSGESTVDAIGLGSDFMDNVPPAKRVVEDHDADPYTSQEVRPGTTPRQLDIGRAALADLERTVVGMRAQKIGAAVLGAELVDEIRMTGGAQLLGKQVKDASDLVALAQIYRDSRFETWRAFFLKDGRIVGESAFTSRLPGSVHLPRDVKGWLSRERARYNADSIYTMHNHPNGPATPSLGDVKHAADLASVKGWAGEVIIDHNEWALLTGYNTPTGMSRATFADLTEEDLEHFGVSITRDPSLGATTPREARIEHSLLGASVSGPGDLPKIGKALQTEAGHAAIILTAGGQVQALVDVPISILQDTKTKLGQAKIKVLVRRLLRNTGGWSRYVVTPKGTRPLDPWLVRRGVFNDVVSASGSSMAATITKRFGTFEWQDMVMRGDRDRTIQLYEPAAPGYDASEPGTRRSRAAEPTAATIEDFNPARASVKDWITHQLAQHRGWAMGALTRDQLADLYAKDMPQVDRFDRVVQLMDLTRNRMTEQADALVERWRKLADADQLADVMHAATLAQFDPDQHNATTPEQTAVAGAFDRLSMPAQELYRDVRDQYRDTLVKIRDALVARVERSGTSGTAVAADIRLRFDRYLETGPYFSLARFGDFILIADKGDERIVQAFESSFQREQRAKALRAQGFTVKLTARQEYSATKDGAAGSFIGDVLEKIDGLQIDAKQKADLMDGLNQLAIGALPDASYRKHFAHRKGTPGFSNDAMRAFASNQMHAAHHLARIRHADELAILIDEMREEIRSARGDVDVTERQQVVNELTRRLDLMLNPNTHPVTAALGQLGFIMSLGGSIASGLVNLTQTPLVTFPWLGAKFGFDAASGALLKASKDYFGGKWNRWSGFVLAENPNLADEERRALRHLEEAGLINLTQAADLAGTANTDSTISRRAFVMNRAMKIVGWTFHTPEVFNRQVSALAAYRLAREAGQTDTRAIESARQALIRTHFDYSSSNRARFMAGNVMRVLMMFKQYAQQMTYLLWRNAYLALKGESADVKREARRMLVGVASMHFAAAGSLGLPLGIFGLSPLLTLLSMGMGDEDEPFDWETEYRNALHDVFGKNGGEAIAKGPLRMLLNVDLASRVGLGDLWVRPPQKDAEGRDLVEAWMITLLGPVAGYAGQMGTAAQAFEEGKFARGVEAMLPKFIASPLKAIRLETEGVRSWNGTDLGITLSQADIAGVAAGFQPAKLAEMYEGRNAVKGREAALQRRRENLMRAWREARDAGDDAGVRDVVEDIRAFNNRNRAFGIGPAHLRAHLMAHRRAQLQTAAGIHLSRRRDELRDVGRFANIE